MEKRTKAAKTIPSERWRAESTLPKQQALLEFLKQPVPLTRGDASDQIAAIFESPGGNAHQKAWHVAKAKLHPDLYAAKTKNKRTSQESDSSAGSLLITVLKSMVVIAGLLYVWYCFQPDADSSDTSDGTDITMPAPTNTANSPARALINLTSTDGRTIRARVLTLTKETATIQREDGQTFVLPLARLTIDSQKRIDEYRTAK